MRAEGVSPQLINPGCPIFNEPAVVQDIVEIIQSRQNFLIIGHLRPDGDCLGSCLGLYETLKQLDKDVRVYTAGPVPQFFSYLPNFDKIEVDCMDGELFDAVLVVDTADLDRVHDGFAPMGYIVNMDHHVTNTRFGAVNWIDGKATAAAEMMYRLTLALGVKISPEIATAYYTGIMTDTGGFRFSNTGETTFLVASHLVQCGANPSEIADYVFGTKRPSAIRITAEVLATLNYEYGGRFIWNDITRQRITNAGGDLADTEGISSEMRSIQGVEIAVLITETFDGYCRLGLRSRGDLNVSEIAGLFGGGGHINASGASIRRPFPEAKEHALSTIRKWLDQYWNSNK